MAEQATTKHTALGTKVVKMLEEYRKTMSVPSNDRQDNVDRIKKLQAIVATACPSTPLDMTTATDIARIMFDEMNGNWGKLYTDDTMFRMGETLKGTAHDMDKMVIFIEAFAQMAECVAGKQRVCFDDERLAKVLKNPNMAIAMGRIKENINKRNGFV